MHLKRNKRKKTGLILLLALAVMAAGVVAVYFMWETAPAQSGGRLGAAEKRPAAISAPEESPVTAEAAAPTPASAPTPTPEPTPEPVPEGAAPVSVRADGIYTVMIVGEDKWTGNTDTILVGRIDTKTHRMDFVSIPRDTLINMDWDLRKINCVYYKAKDAGRDPALELKTRVAELIGFEVDCYAIVDLEAFIQVVDAVGGVEFDVPQDIYFEDYTMVDNQWEDTYNCIYAGKQTLSGFQAMGLVRYRHGYQNGDLGRIEVQHDFLRACAEQFISLGNIPNIGKVLDILSERIDTDLSTANIAWFFRQALQCSAEDINFHTMPSTPRILGEGYSYAVILVYDWLEMINTYLNPFSEPLTFGNLNVMYKDYFGYSCTAEIRGGWYYVGAAEAELMEAGFFG